MCCLTYEHDAYLQARKRFPREGKTIRTAVGQEKVIGIDIWRDLVTLLDESRQRRTVGLADLRAEIAAAPREEEPAAAATAPAPTPNDAAGITPTEGASRRRRKKRSERRNGGGEPGAPPPAD